MTTLTLGSKIRRGAWEDQFEAVLKQTDIANWLLHLKKLFDTPEFSKVVEREGVLRKKIDKKSCIKSLDLNLHATYWQPAIIAFCQECREQSHPTVVTLKDSKDKIAATLLFYVKEKFESKYTTVLTVTLVNVDEFYLSITLPNN